MPPRLTVSVLEARGLAASEDVVCTLTLGKEKITTGRCRGGTQWLEDHHFIITDPHAILKVAVSSEKTGPIGSCSVKVSEIKGSIPGRFFPLVGNGWRSAGELSMALVLDLAYQTPKKSPQKPAAVAKLPARPAARGRGGKSKSLADDILADLPALGLLVAAAGLAVSLAMRKKQKAKAGPALYEVQEGDTLCSIAACLNTSAKKILEQNTDIITNPNFIYPGERLRL